MPILIDNPDADRLVQEQADAQPVKTSKAALAASILIRACRMDAKTLNRWLRNVPGIDKPRAESDAA